MIPKSLLAALVLISPAAAMQPAGDDLPELRPLWTITSDDCVGVHADAEPWAECGFQSFVMNADASRILTASQAGVIQLWDGDGRELRRIEWPDQPGGGSSHPSARTAIVGGLGIAVVHQNQLAVIDLADGRILNQHVVDAMRAVENLRPFGGRLFAEARSRDREHGVIEIALPSGDVRPMPGWRDLTRLGRGYYVAGERPPFRIHFADSRPPVQSERGCLPHNADYCVWRDTGDRRIHLFDPREGRWRSFDTGRALGDNATAHVIGAGGRPYALLCDIGTGPARDCSIVDLEAGRELHRFASNDWRADVGTDERGVAEIRVRVHTDTSPHGGQSSIRGVAVDGRVREIDPTGRVRLGLAGGILLLPRGESESELVGPNGRRLGRLSIPYYGGYGQLVGRRWLLPVAGPRTRTDAEGDDHDTALAMYELPD